MSPGSIARDAAATVGYTPHRSAAIWRRGQALSAALPASAKGTAADVLARMRTIMSERTLTRAPIQNGRSLTELLQAQHTCTLNHVAW